MMKKIELTLKSLLVFWMVLNAGLYFLVLLPLKSKIAYLMPEIVMQAQAYVYPWFSAAASVN